MRACLCVCMSVCLCVCVHACVCACVCMCVCVRVHECLQPALICQSNMETRILSEHAPIVIASLNISSFKVLSNFNCGNPCLHGAANFPPTPPLCPGFSRHTQGRFLMTLVLSNAVRGAWAGLRRAASSSYQTLSHFFPQHCSLHPLSPKLVFPDKRVCLACLPSFRPGSWLRGSGQALILNFPNFRSGVRPAAPPPAPPLPLTPQGCLICKSGSLCKFWGRGVRWAGLHTLV